MALPVALPPWHLVVQAIISGLLIGCVYALIALGLALIWGVMEVVNFAHGEFLMIAGYLACFLFALYGIDPILSAFLGFIVAGLIGLAIQKGVVEKVLGSPPIVTILVTFSVLLIMCYGALAALGPEVTTTHPWYGVKSIHLGPIAIPLVGLICAGASLAATGVLYVFLTRTYTGIALRATAQNRMAAQLQGIDIKKMYALAFVIGTALTGFAGGLLASFFYIYPEVGARFCALSFVIVVLGGFGSLPGAFVGGLIIGVAEEVAAVFIPPVMKDVVAFIIFILVLLFKPTGLFGGRAS